MARGLPILTLSLFIFDVSIPARPAELVLFALSGFMGYLIIFMINFIVGLLAFWFLEVFPFQLFKYGLITIFSGGIVPVDFFPEVFQPFVAMLPFQYILYAPTVILMGHSAGSQGHGGLLAGQVFWVIALFAGCNAMWRAGQKKLVIQGG